MEQLKSRASFDLQCRPETITSQPIDAYTTIATGCGRQAVYVEHCTRRDRTGCTWLLNSPVRPAVDTAQWVRPDPPSTAETFKGR